MQLPHTVHFGSGSITFETPDTILVVFAGVIDKTAASICIEQVVEWSRGKPCTLFLVNIKNVTSISPEARKILTTNGHRLPPRALSLFGGSFATRVIFDLMDRASWLMGSKNRSAKHWPNEQSARAWAAEMRTVLLANAEAQTKSARGSAFDQ